MSMHLGQQQYIETDPEYAKDPYSELKQFSRILRVRTKKDWDVVVAVTGEEGVGKSVTACKIAQLADPYFSITHNELIGTNEKKLQEKITKFRKGAAIVADEAIKILYKQNWANAGQKFINVLFTLARKENKITFLCIPRFRDLNEYFRNHRVKFWVHVISRGVAVVFVRDWSPFAKDPWWMDEAQKKIDSLAKQKKIHDVDTELKIKILSQTKNYLTTIHTPDFTDEEREEYNRVVSSNKLSDYKQGEMLSKMEKRYKERLILICKNMLLEGATLDDIGKAMGMSLPLAQNFLSSNLPDYKDIISNKTKRAKQLNSSLGGTKTLKGAVGWRKNG